MKTILRFLSLLVAFSGNAMASTVLYSTDFGFPPFNPGDSWIGQDGWKGNISDTSAAQGTFGSPDNGVYLGFNDPGVSTVFIWKEFFHDPIGSGQSVIEVDFNLGIVDSTNGFYDMFTMQIYNGSGAFLASIALNNSTLAISRNDGVTSTSTGYAFQNGITIPFSLAIDFAANTWSAYYNITPLFEDEVFHAGAAALDFGDVTFSWQRLGASHGDNYLSMDFFEVRAIPEPSAFALGALAFCMSLIRRRSR